MEYWRLLAHSHWLTLRVLGREIRLCARCSGYALGLLSSAALRYSFGLGPFTSLNVGLQFLVCLLLILPLTFDWLTQSWGLRESNNRLRLLTGAMLGVGTSLFLLIGALPPLKNSYYLSAAIVIAILGSMGELLDKRLSRPQLV